MSSKKLRIFLGDITHDTIILVSDTIPINIGFIASYINKLYGEKVEIELFKYPKDIISEIKKNPPDVLALSNYSWNSNLSEFIASLAKKISPNVVTVQGGTNFPHDEETQRTIKDGWLKTGDLGFIDDDGYLFIVDRKKALIIRGGENISTLEIENNLDYLEDVTLITLVSISTAFITISLLGL